MDEKDTKKESFIEEMGRTVDFIKKECLCDEGETWLNHRNSNNFALVENGFSVKTEITPYYSDSSFQLKYENKSAMDTARIEPSENDTNTSGHPVKEEVDNDFHEEFEIKNDDDLENITHAEYSEQNHNEDLQESNTTDIELPNSVHTLENEEIKQENAIGFNTVKDGSIKNDVDKCSGVMMRNLLTDAIEVLQCGSQLQRHDDDVRLKPKESYKCNYHDSTILKPNHGSHIKMKHQKKICRKQTEANQCPHCDYSPIIKGSLKRHINNIHFGVKKYECKMCNFSTAWKHSLNKHLRVKHDQETIEAKKMKKCTECDYSTRTRSDLRYHINFVHLKLKEYTCIFCDFSATNEKYLRDHVQNVHFGEKKYDCNYCSYSTIMEKSYRMHLKNKHNKESAS